VVEKNHMKFPKKLYLSEFLANPLAPSPQYQLVGLIENIGSTPNSGHCIAYRRLPLETSEYWIKCNDSTVTEVDIEEVMERNAMVLLYEQLEPLKKKTNNLEQLIESDNMFM
jgi:hypothetical protein